MPIAPLNEQFIDLYCEPLPDTPLAQPRRTGAAEAYDLVVRRSCEILAPDRAQRRREAGLFGLDGAEAVRRLRVARRHEWHILPRAQVPLGVGKLSAAVLATLREERFRFGSGALLVHIANEAGGLTAHAVVRIKESWWSGEGCLILSGAFQPSCGD